MAASEHDTFPARVYTEVERSMHDGGPRNLTIATLIGQQVTEVLNWPFAGALSGVLLVLSLALVALFRRFLQLGIGR